MSDNLYQKRIDNSPDFVFESRVDNFQFTRVNERACTFYGYSKSEFMNMNIFDIEVSPPLKEQVRELYDNTTVGSILEVFGSNRKKDGTAFPVHVRFSKINEEFAIANVRDITEQRNKEKALYKANAKLKKMSQKLEEANEKLEIRVNERTKALNDAYKKIKIEIKDRSQIQKYAENLSNVVEQTADLVMITDLSGTIEYVNPAFESLTGFTVKEAIGQTPRILKTGLHDKSFYKDLWKSIISGKVYRGVLINKKVDGSHYYEEKTITPVRDKEGKITHFVSTGRDVTERIKTEEILLKSKKRLRSLASRIESIREEERSNISRTIHDDLGHALTGIQFDLHALSKHPNLQKVEIIEKMDSIINQVQQSFENLKRIASDLRPGVLDKLGLDAAIEWQLNQFQAKTNIKCKQNIKELTIEINNFKSTTIFRIFQEILANIIRHSQAEKVIVTLRNNHDIIELNVQDNGIGILNKDLENIDSLGILGMQERASMAGGVLKIARMKKGGTEVKIAIPV